jgi:hypothetical protein
MGVAIMFAPCLVCKVPFSFNPVKVPSLRVNGVKEPICRSCHTDLNKLRVEKGVPPFPEPHPDAYTACDEEELP